MKLIFKIARVEIQSLFYSPVAWFLGIAFLILCSIFYTKNVEEMALFQESALKNSPDFKGFQQSLTVLLFLREDGILKMALQNLYFFIPLLTMGVINRDINQSTIKLLFSAPIKSVHIVLGKYLAILTYNFILVGILGVFMVLGYFSILNVEAGILLSAALSFFFLVSALSAIGVFMSSLTNYQIVAGVGTFLIIFVLFRIDGLWQQYDFFRDLTYFLSLNGRTNQMMVGMITSKDVIYFILITVMFLCFTLIKMRSMMESKSWKVQLGRYLGVIVIVLAFGYVSSLPSLVGYWDSTRNKVNTIHPNTQRVIQDFDKNIPLEVTLYSNLLDRSYAMTKPAERNRYLWEFWSKYLQFKSNIKFNYVYYYAINEEESNLFLKYPNKSLKEIAEIVAEVQNDNLDRFIPGEEVDIYKQLKDEGFRSIMKVKYGDKETMMRTFDDNFFWPNETNASAAFKRLQREEVPKILYTTGNLERDIYKTGEREFNMHALEKSNRLSLINIGFDVDTINLDKDNIPENIHLLTVADPKTALSPLKTEKIERYINQGGNVFFLGETEKQMMLNPLLKGLGLQLGKGTIVEVTKDQKPDHVITWLNPKSVVKLSEEFYFVKKALKENTKPPGMAMETPGVVEVLRDSTPSNFEYFAIGQTDSSRNGFIKMGKLVIDSIPPKFDPTNGDIKREVYTTIMGLSRKKENKEQRIAVTGDADFLSNMRGKQALYFVNSIYSWQNQNVFPIYFPKDPSADTSLTISHSISVVQRILFVYVIPILLIGFASILLIRRKRK